jgi:hypothetical protein
MLGRFARVDHAALRLGNNRFHAAPLRWFAQGRALIDPDCGTGLVSAAAGAGSPAPAADTSSLPRKPKKRGPFQLVPVILRAMADRLAKTCPCQQKPPGTTRTSCTSQQAHSAGAEEFTNARIKTSQDFFLKPIEHSRFERNQRGKQRHGGDLAGRLLFCNDRLCPQAKANILNRSHFRSWPPPNSDSVVPSINMPIKKTSEK